MTYTTYLTHLTDADAAVRLEAAHKLGRQEAAAPITSALIAALPDADSKVQYAVVSALVKHRTTAALHPILDVLLIDIDNRIWGLLGLNIGMRLRSGLLDLAQPGDATLADRLHAALDRAEFTILQRAFIVRMLGRTADARFTDLLIDLVRTGHPMLRGPAAEALGHQGDLRAVDALLAYVRDGQADDQIREPAAIALGRLKAAHVYDDLAAALYDDNEFVRAASATALGDLGDRRAIELLSQVMLKDTGLVADAAFAALRQFGDGSSFNYTL